MSASNRLADGVRDRLQSGDWPRVHCLLIVALASGAAFLVSVALLALQVNSMALRYGLAALAGYGSFLLLIRAWVRWKSSRLVPDAGVDLGDLPVVWPSSSGVDVGTSAFGGGRSGGGGASMAWDARGTSASAAPSGSGGGKLGGLSLDLDGDDLVWLLVALAAAFAGVLAIGYVVYVAPTLLGEAALHAAVAAPVYHGLKQRESHYWTTDVVRRTGVAAAVLIVSVSAAGYAMQRVAPEARSIGGVWQHLTHRA